MPEAKLANFQILRELISCSERRVYEAIPINSTKPVRLTVFTAEISQRSAFRRALKTDRAMLSMLRHQSIVKFLGSGESDGAFFFWTASCDSETATDAIHHQRKLSTEDIIEIGWQTCSALQQAHNVGLSHGGLSCESVLLSENVQVTLIDFGVERWLRSARQSDREPVSGAAPIVGSTLASREDFGKDLTDLAAVLSRLLSNAESVATESEVGHLSARIPLERLLARAAADAPPGQGPVSAREFQGRLGEILIGTDGDVMPLVDQRNAATTSKRSIVVELFGDDEPRTQKPDTPFPSATPAWQKQILPIAAAIALLIVLTLLADWLF